MSERAIHIGTLVGALALAGWVFGVRGQGRATTRANDTRSVTSPLAIIPPGSAFVLTADVAQLRRAALGVVLAERLGHLGASAANLSSSCGFDPVSALDQLVLAVPSAGATANEQTGDFGVVATGHFSAAQITRCASASITARAGDPVSTELGAFSSVRDRKAESGEVAARDGGPLILSGGRYFRQLLDAAADNGPKREHEDPRDARHAELRRALGPGTVEATWLLSEGWFERVSGDTSARLSPLRNLKALGARLDVGRELRVSVLLDCADAATATEIEALLDQLRSSFGALPLDPALRGVAQRITALHEGTRLRLDSTFSAQEVQALLDATLGPASSAPPVASAATGATSSPEIRRFPAK